MAGIHSQDDGFDVDLNVWVKTVAIFCFPVTFLPSMVLDPGHPWPGRRSIFLFMQQRRLDRGTQEISLRSKRYLTA